MKKSKHALDIVSVIENLELPVPDNSIKKIDIESKNTLKKPEVGCSLDDILKQKIISLNGDKVYIYHNKNIKKVGDANVFENSYEHIYKIVNNKYGSSIYRNIDNKEEINNTANYLTQLIKQIDFRQFKAKQLIGINWKLIQGKSLPNTTIRLMVNKYEVDIVMDDLI
ncbi:MAG: hypothetical protein SGJ10_08325, partial [Bacteroidota bacterium]|nr:hypothetical protein [Bacteroidota bacterium]